MDALNDGQKEILVTLAGKAIKENDATAFTFRPGMTLALDASVLELGDWQITACRNVVHEFDYEYRDRENQVVVTLRCIIHRGTLPEQYDP